MRPIIVIDDHELAHSGIRLLLAGCDRFTIGGCYTSARDGLAAAAAAERPLILLDLELPDVDGLSALGEVIGRDLAEVVILTGVTRPEMLRRALDLGARGLVCKGDPIEEVHEALRAVDEGRTYVSRCAADMLASAQGSAVVLSERQHAILQLLAAGCSNKEIGYRLSITPPTVSFHLAEIRRKLKADNSRQLVEKARAAGVELNSRT